MPIVLTKEDLVRIRQAPKFSDVGAGPPGFLPHEVSTWAVEEGRKSGIHIARFPVPEVLRRWEMDFPGYKPTAIDFPGYRPLNLDVPWDRRNAHPDDPLDAILEIDFETGEQGARHPNGRPRNPFGRTGMVGRETNLLWGPMPAVDIWIITKHPKTGHPWVFVITRDDNGKFASPGGAVDDKERPFDAMDRELWEETRIPKRTFDFQKAPLIYAGYMKDNRNTDESYYQSMMCRIDLPWEQAMALRFAPTEEAPQLGWKPVTERLLGNMHACLGPILRYTLYHPPIGAYEFPAPIPAWSLPEQILRDTHSRPGWSGPSW